LSYLFAAAKTKKQPPPLNQKPNPHLPQALPFLPKPNLPTSIKKSTTLSTKPLPNSTPGFNTHPVMPVPKESSPLTLSFLRRQLRLQSTSQPHSNHTQKNQLGQHHYYL